MKEGEKNICTIIFDFNGVLILGKCSEVPYRGHHSLGIHEYIANKLKISLDQWLDAIDSTYAKAIEGKISNKQLIKTLSKNTATSPIKLEKIIIDSYKKHFKENKQLFEKTIKLKKLGYKIGILSDQWYFSKQALMSNKKINKFDSVIISCDVGMRKPNPEIYKIALKKLKTSAKNSLFIDNQKWNTLAADKLGFKTILFRDNKPLFKEKSWGELFK